MRPYDEKKGMDVLDKLKDFFNSILINILHFNVFDQCSCYS